MKISTKTTALLITTFLLGAICGAIVQGFIVKRGMKKFVQHMRTPGGFVERFERIVEPTVEQRKEIRAILRRHHQQIMRLQNEFPAQMDSIRDELDAILTPEQKQRLHDKHWFKDERKHQRDRRPHFRGSHPDSLPPPPPMPPGGFE